MGIKAREYLPEETLTLIGEDPEGFLEKGVKLMMYWKEFLTDSLMLRQTTLGE